ncbi:uncharacterized protein LOC113280763 [Papaver somniferum]|uniref:uncharacterized protein LOC113280763 n=1 Tax=Papaver somniferum TaxID=3469 RepID=UPI000E6F680C|nr:uncharacterized protein LOC113280763 [Papaver somniferum]
MREEVDPVVLGSSDQTLFGRSFFAKKKELIPDASLEFEDKADGKRVADIVFTDVEEDLDHCKDLVIGALVGRKLPYMLVKNTLQIAWRIKRAMHMTIHGEFLYVFEFEDEADRLHAIEYGPVYISQQLFFVRPWHALIEQEIAEMKYLPTWVNLRKIPLHMWNAKAISKIASVIGKPIMMHKLTDTRAIMSFARVLVEIAVDCEYPSYVPVYYEGKHVVDVEVEYPWKPPKCSECNCFGHVAAKCPWAEPKETPVVTKKTTEKGISQAWIVKGSRKSTAKLNVETSKSTSSHMEQETMDAGGISPSGDKENVFMEIVNCSDVPITNKFDVLLEENSGFQVLNGVIPRGGVLPSIVSTLVNKLNNSVNGTSSEGKKRCLFKWCYWKIPSKMR